MENETTPTGLAPLDEKTIDPFEQDGDASGEHLRDVKKTVQITDTATPAAEPEQFPTGLNLALILVALFMSSFLAALDMGIVATAIPQITDQFRQLDQVGWYGSAYFMTVGVFASFWGKLHKYYPTKIVFLCSVGLFEIGSLVAATSPTSPAFIVGRAIQGWGAAGIVGGGFLIINYISPREKRPAYTGLLGAVFVFSVIVGPVVGGAFTTRVSWRWCFYINVPIGCVVILIILVLFHTPKHVQRAQTSLKEVLLHIDIPGTVLLIASLVCFILAMQWGGLSKEWSSGPVIATSVLWVVLTMAFVAVEIFQGEYAMIPPRLAKQRMIWANSLVLFSLNNPDFVFLYYLPIYFQSVHGLSAIGSGVSNLTFIAPFAVGCLLGGVVVGKILHYQPIETLGALISVVGAALIYTFDIETSRSMYLGSQVLLGFGIGLSCQLPVTAVQAFSNPVDLAPSTGVVLTAQTISGCYFVTAAQSIFNNRLIAALAEFGPDISPNLVLNTGATDIRTVFSGADLASVIQSYLVGLKGVFALGVAGCAFSVLVTLLVPMKKLPAPPQPERKSDKETV